MSVIDFNRAREERQPHWEGTVVCLGCRHEWEGVGPIGTHAALGCPSCGFPKGVIKYPFSASTGDLELRCDCGCEALTAYVRQGFKRVRCMACGNDLTESFFA